MNGHFNHSLCYLYNFYTAMTRWSLCRLYEWNTSDVAEVTGSVTSTGFRRWGWFVQNYSSGRLQLKCDGTRWPTRGEVKGNWRMEWVASTLRTTSEHGVSSIASADAHTSAASSRLNWQPADLNGLVRFAERRNLVSARVPSNFNWLLQHSFAMKILFSWTNIMYKYCV